MNYKLEYIALHRMDHREPKTSNNKLLDWEKKVVEIRVTAVKMQKNERWYIGIYCGNRNDKNFWVLGYTVETGMTRISEVCMWVLEERAKWKRAEKSWPAIHWNWKWFSCVQLLSDSMDYTVHGILQARILDWVAFPFSSRSSQPRNWTRVFCIAGRFFTNWVIR